MAFSIKPATTIEEEVYQRILDGIPPGDFYLRANSIQPRRKGKTVVPFIIEGTRSEPDGQGRRIMVDVYINEQFTVRTAMTANQIYINLTLLPPPDINYIRVIEGIFDPTTGYFAPTGNATGTSVVVVNYGTVHYGVSLDFYRKIALPLQYQRHSLLSEWSNRLVQWYFRYHRRFPDTQAMQVLATRLASRATWNELPSTRGVTDMVAALCASEPVITEISNQRPTLDLALYPFLPVCSNWGGFQFDIWFPDYPTAKEIAVLKLAKNTSDYLSIRDYEEGHIFLDVQGTFIDLRKDESSSNLQWLLRQIGPMDTWSSYVQIDHDVQQYWRFWDNSFDNLVQYPGLGAGDTFDTDIQSNPSHSDTFDSGNLDTSQEEPFTELWTGLGVNTGDSVGTWDSVTQVARSEGQIPRDAPLAWEWEWTEIDMEVSANNEISNTLHGGAPPDYTV